jgi:DNA-binding MarR family transcriptional regulator
MTPEEVARASQFREGFTLVDYAEVGLPIFRLTLEAVTTAYRTLPTIQEFAMRCLSLGETREEEIARMLGLRLEVVTAAINILVSDGYVVRLATPADLQSFRLTEAGEARLKQERIEVPQEEMLVIDYDGIRRTPIRLAGTSVLRASELKARGAIEIRPYPAEPPGIGELQIPEVTRVIRRQGSEDFRRTVLALKRIVRRHNVFREAVALVFAADRGDEVQVGFNIDGKISEAHERAFAENGGPRKMGFVRALSESDARGRVERMVGREMLGACPDRAELISLRQAEAEAEAKVRSLRPAAEGSARGSPAAAALSAARERLTLAQHDIASLPVRPLACYDQVDLLHEAVEKARMQLLITSAGLQASIINLPMIRQIEQLASSRVAVSIETVLAPQLKPRGGNYFDPLAELTKRSEKGVLRLTKGPRREFYFLIQDDDLAVISSRPFLGEATRRTGFIRLTGLVTRRPDMVRTIRETLLSAGREARRIA